MDRLTKIEKLYAKAWGIEDLPSLSPEILRDSMKSVAYHEAGHFAARLFTGLELSHVTAISIIGNEENAGYVRSTRNFTQSVFGTYPPLLKRSNGYMLLIHHLSGYGSEAILDGTGKWKDVFEYYENTYCDIDLLIETSGTDFNRALKIAEIMSTKFMPANRILTLADRWTLQMLSIPAVWNIVETVADILIQEGRIEGDNAVDGLMSKAFDMGFPLVYKLPKWKRRLIPKLAEMEQYIERV